MAFFDNKSSSAAKLRGASAHGASARGARRVSQLTKQQRRTRRTVLRALTWLLVIVVAFACGFLVRSNVSLMAQLGVIANTDEIEVNPGATIHGNTSDSISARIAELEAIVNKYSMTDYDLDMATSSMLQSFISSVPDKYMRYFNPSRYRDYVQESVSGSYAGVGVLFAEYNGVAYAADVFDGSIAQASGVQQGDFIVAINGDRSQSWTVTEVANALSQAEGESFVITWRRPKSLEASGGDEFTTTLTTKEYHETNVTSGLINDSVGYINIRQITADAASLVSDAIEVLTEDGARALVLDMRDCPGGYLTQAVDLADLFLSEGIICQIETVEGVSNKTATSVCKTTLPMAVLANEYTSAAAEVVVAALKDNERASFVGVKTLGKGSVQVTRELSFGGAIRYTAAYYLTPLGNAIDDAGITPNVVVTNEDYQLTIAVETALSRKQA